MIKSDSLFFLKKFRRVKLVSQPIIRTLVYPNISVYGSNYIPCYKWSSHVPEEKKGKITSPGKVEYQIFLPHQMIHIISHIQSRADEPPI